MQPGGPTTTHRKGLTVTTNTQPISGAEAAAAIAGLVPGVTRVETYPQWSDGAGPTRRHQMVTLLDGNGVAGADQATHREVWRVLARLDGDWDRPQTFDVAAGELSPTFPVVMSLPEALSNEPIPYVLADPAAAPAPSFAADVAAGHAETVGAWVARTGTERTAGGAA